MASALNILFEASKNNETNGMHLALSGQTLYGYVSLYPYDLGNGLEVGDCATSYLLEVTFEGM